MNKFIKIAAALAVVLSLSACGDSKRVCGRMYDTYGLLSDDEKHPDIHYTAIAGNVVWGILLSETIIAPVYFFGFSLYEPNEPQVACELFDHNKR